MKARFCTEENMNNTEIKTLNECKEYFKKLYTDCLVENAFEQSILIVREKHVMKCFVTHSILYTVKNLRK